MKQKLKKTPLIKKTYKTIKLLYWNVFTTVEGRLLPKIGENPIWVKTSTINFMLERSTEPRRDKILKKNGTVFGETGT